MDILGIFFFQAEDGIRDYKVTGVQTCALPILHICPHFEGGEVAHSLFTFHTHSLIFTPLHTVPYRSEERRVGKECRSRWSPYH